VDISYEKSLFGVGYFAKDYLSVKYQQLKIGRNLALLSSNI